jgi:hypothetical protein
MTSGILCTTDFSIASRDALKWSIDLAQKLDCHLTVLHTFRLYKHNGEAVLLKKEMEKNAMENFKSLENELLATSGIAYDFKTEIGFMADRVEDHAKKNVVNFLVIGKNMTVQNREAFDELVEQLHVPLVIIP